MKNIVLIGMSGVGKTQKGKYIARKMDRNFLDTDRSIVEQEGITIDEIFTKFGENYFSSIRLMKFHSPFYYRNLLFVK